MLSPSSTLAASFNHSISSFFRSSVLFSFGDAAPAPHSWIRSFRYKSSRSISAVIDFMSIFHVVIASAALDIAWFVSACSFFRARTDHFKSLIRVSARVFAVHSSDFISPANLTYPFLASTSILSASRLPFSFSSWVSNSTVAQSSIASFCAIKAALLF